MIITGVLAGMDISTGNEVAAHRWELLPEAVPYAFVAPPEKNLSVPLVWLPSCAWLMTRLLIDNPYTWNGRRRTHRGLQKINTIEKNQQDRTDGLRTIPIGKRRRRYRAQLRPHRTGSLGKRRWPYPPDRLRAFPFGKRRRRYRAQLRPHRNGKRRWSHPALRLSAIRIEKRRRQYRAHPRPHRNGKR